MKYDASFFDTPVVRRGTDCIKWDDLQKNCGNPDAIPMWVADMDFRCPPEVTEALVARAAHGVFGYGQENPDERAAVVDFMAARHNWKVDPDSLVWSPSVLSTLKVAIQLFTKPGEASSSSRRCIPPSSPSPATWAASWCSIPSAAPTRAGRWTWRIWRHACRRAPGP